MPGSKICKRIIPVRSSSKTPGVSKHAHSPQNQAAFTLRIAAQSRKSLPCFPPPKLHPQGLPEAYSYWPGKISGLSRIPQNQPSEYAPLPALSRYLIHRCVLCDLLSVRCVKNRLLFTETRVFAPSNPFHQFNPESWLFQLQLT